METTTTEPPVLLMLLLFGCLASLLPGVAANWDDWWTYEGISGPDFWGRLNPAWSLCSTGRRQSPVNIEPRQLLFDPNLKPIAVSNHRVDGLLQNTGQGIVFRLSEDDELGGVNISLGPLSYRYRVYELRLHFGRTEDRGSEHSVSGFVFPAELQILGYNCDLYANVSEARQRAQGLVALAVIIKLRDSANVELRLLTSQLLHLAFKGSQVAVKSVSIRDLLPDTDSYMTYEGSSTTPGCEETVTWILMNRPLYMTRQQLFATRKLMQGDAFHPKAPLGNNFRPTQPLHGRVVRTNIDIRSDDCPGMQVNKFYQANLDLLSR
ncbi:carbonic anhydrase-related protein 10-like [Dermacentor silvarum]|uniref:carbonic anhydrase-related protein 10-like n=1 Tax=Dermacentor silvarum TaxID=543639 RepID=UPI00189A115A|nr:carbonic anhydrase-related protein 10-like [Dermacentor silvarum]